MRFASDDRRIPCGSVSFQECTLSIQDNRPGMRGPSASSVPDRREKHEEVGLQAWNLSLSLSPVPGFTDSESSMGPMHSVWRRVARRALNPRAHSASCSGGLLIRGFRRFLGAISFSRRNRRPTEHYVKHGISDTRLRLILTADRTLRTIISQMKAYI